MFENYQIQLQVFSADCILVREAGWELRSGDSSLNLMNRSIYGLQFMLQNVNSILYYVILGQLVGYDLLFSQKSIGFRGS